MSIFERKCVEPECWHFRVQGYVYCSCCLHGKCSTFSLAQRDQYEREATSLAAQTSMALICAA